MSISRINQFNTDRFMRFQANAGNDDSSASIFASALSKVNPEMIEKSLEMGLSEKTIISQLLMTSGVNAQDKDLIETLTEEFSAAIEEAQENLKKNKNSEITDEDAGKNEEKAPEKIKDKWNIEDTGNIFKENISKENFLDNLKTLNENATDNDYFAEFLKSINEAGGENFFNTLDTNNSGFLDKSELEAIINADNDNSSISLEEFNSILEKIQKPEDGETPIEIPDNSNPTGNPVTGSQGIQETSPSGNTQNTHSSSSSDNTSNTSSDNEPAKETVEELMKQKQQVISDADKEIADLNKQIDTLIDNSNADEGLKTNYKNAKTAYDNNQKSISDNETKINSYESDIHKADTSMAALEGELSSLKTDTNDEEVNKKNAARKEQINKQLSELKTKKQELENKKQEAENTNNTLTAQTPSLQKAVDDAYNALMEKLPDEVKQKINELKSQIQTAESNKTAKVQELDSKISTLKTQEVQESRKSGETVGRIASNSIGAQFVQDALKYLGFNEKDGSYKKFSTGDYGWCADFVSYVVKEVAQKMGMSEAEIKDLKTHLGASPYKLRTRNPEHYLTDKSKFQSMVQPGMAFICGGSGASGEHTGLVAEVYPDGTFLSIEGNHDDKVTQVRRKFSDMKGFVDFTYLMKA